jgi:2-isopropylmalate synthase
LDIQLFDVTLGEGARSAGLRLSVDERLEIARLLDDLGVHVIGAAQPADAVDAEYFHRVRELPLRQATISVLGSTRRSGACSEDDPGLAALVSTHAPVTSISGSSWDQQVTGLLETTLEENLASVRDSVAYLRAAGRAVVFDAGHFFDGFRSNPGHALAAINAAAEAGAECIFLCDSNGGSLPGFIKETVGVVCETIRCRLGIHCHNDADLAVANTLAAVEAGCTLVRGAIHGWGERCGTANLLSLLPALQLKMKRRCVPDERLARLTDLSRRISTIARVRASAYSPYVGASAFAHKGGAHAAAVEKLTSTYEHVSPQSVGNQRKIVVSELSGRGSIRMRAAQLGIDLRGRDKEVVERVKDLENEGYQLEVAEGTLELLLRRWAPGYQAPFEVLYARVVTKRRAGTDPSVTATLKLRIGNGSAHVVAEGSGPVNALDRAFRKALESHYPVLEEIRILDYAVRIVGPEVATGGRTRVLIETGHGSERWRTIGVSTNVVEASCMALIDALELPLVRQRTSDARTRPRRPKLSFGGVRAEAE